VPVALSSPSAQVGVSRVGSANGEGGPQQRSWCLGFSADGDGEEEDGGVDDTDIRVVAIAGVGGDGGGGRSLLLLMLLLLLALLLLAFLRGRPLGRLGETVVDGRAAELFTSSLRRASGVAVSGVGCIGRGDEGGGEDREEDAESEFDRGGQADDLGAAPLVVIFAAALAGSAASPSLPCAATVLLPPTPPCSEAEEAGCWLFLRCLVRFIHVVVNDTDMSVVKTAGVGGDGGGGRSLLLLLLFLLPLLLAFLRGRPLGRLGEIEDVSSASTSTSTFAASSTLAAVVGKEAAT